jgi:hypothetical protein
MALVLIAAFVLARWTAAQPRFPDRPDSADSATPEDITIRRQYEVPAGGRRAIEVELNSRDDPQKARMPMRRNV